MISDTEIWRSAILLIDQYGADAGFVAAWSADAMLARRNLIGRAVWRRIFNAIEELRRTERKAAEPLN